MVRDACTCVSHMLFFLVAAEKCRSHVQALVDATRLHRAVFDGGGEEAVSTIAA